MIYLLCLVAETTGLVGASGPGEADDGRLLPVRAVGGGGGGREGWVGSGEEQLAEPRWEAAAKGARRRSGSFSRRSARRSGCCLGTPRTAGSTAPPPWLRQERGERREERTCVVMNGFTTG
jgi:hypothetical protein